MAAPDIQTNDPRLVQAGRAYAAMSTKTLRQIEHARVMAQVNYAGQAQVGRASCLQIMLYPARIKRIKCLL